MVLCAPLHLHQYNFSFSAGWVSHDLKERVHKQLEHWNHYRENFFFLLTNMEEGFIGYTAY